MKDFTSKTYNFRTISLGQKAVYTVFLAFVFLGWVTILAFYLQKTGLSYASLIDYYHGNEEKLQYTKTFLELWEATHFHLFTVPIVFLILAHLFMLTNLKPLTKLIVCIGGALGIVVDVGSPWLIVYAAPEFAALKIAGRILMNASLLVLIAQPLMEMWVPPGPGRQSR